MAREGWRGRSTTNTRRSRARGDPYAAAHQLKDAVRRLSRNNNALWLWVPAFAGTTMRTHLRIPAAQYARSCARISRPENKGRGECRVPGAPAAPCATKTHRGRSHRYTGTPGIPARNGFNGFLRDLPGDRACLSPSPAEICVSGPIGPTSQFHRLERQRRGVRTTRLRRPRHAPFVKGAFASTASRSNVRDDRETPLKWDGMA